MSLDTLIDPEIVSCDLAKWLEKLAAREDVRTILEIGSSDGRGSTAALVRGAKTRSYRPFIHCVEMSKVRFEALEKRYENEPRMLFHWGSAVPVSEWMTARDVADFYNNEKTNLNQYPLEQVLSWHKQDVDYMESHKDIPDRILRTLTCQSVVPFDLVFLDGGAFSGDAEWSELYGAKIVVFDDCLDIKHFDNRKRLKADPDYKLVHENLMLRNGFCVFEKVA